jgi:hypothetical protein
MKSWKFKQMNAFNSQIGSRSRAKSGRKLKSIAYCIQVNESVVSGRGPGAVVALVVIVAWMVGERVDTTKYTKHTKGSRWVGEF